MAETSPATQSTQSQAEEHADATVYFTPEQLAPYLHHRQATPEALARMAADVGITAAELDKLRAGQTGLAMTPAQHAQVLAILARRYASQPAEGTPAVANDHGDAWGCSGSPQPQPQPARQIPSLTSPRTDVHETGPGTGLTDQAGAGGRVVVRYNIPTDMGNAFAISYTGPNSENSHWLQFIWREAIGEKADHSVVVITDPIRTNAGQYNLTGGGTMARSGTPTRDNYNTDSLDSSNPFYESTPGSNRTADSTTMYDTPGNLQALVQRMFGPAMSCTRVITRAHFVDYLVQDDRVSYQTGITLQWTFNAATDTPTPTATAGTTGATTHLDPVIKAKFLAQYPTYAFIDP
jgi:hypothetical protein